MKLKLLLCLVAFSSWFALAQRLPEVAVPEHYELKLAPDFTSNTFSGEETIDIRVLKPTASIRLNALEIIFDEATIESAGLEQKAEVTIQPVEEMATLTVPKPLLAGGARISIRYKGKLNTDLLRGLYLSQAAGRKYAVTQFEPTDARRAFPSFDEPAYKAVFDISVVAPAAATAISNGKIIADMPGPTPGTHTIRFASTPKMSTYLVAVLVGEFQCLQGEAGQVPIRVCTVPGQQQLGSFALEAATHFLPFYNQFFSIKYPYGKLDLIGVPDFEFGAMENTAAITFRGLELLVDAKTAPAARLKTVAVVIAHEMAHQWFGDLVTMKWWDDIWLNEGFATWLEVKPVEAWKPEWHMELEEQESADQAMNVDSLENTRPIRAAAQTSAQINELFDAIAYNKTAAVLRMLESFLGAEVFRRGVNQYLENHSYANATAEDFWKTMTTVSRQPVDEIMRSFVEQPGVPRVSLTSHCADNTVRAAQRRFTFSQSTDTAAKERWNMPVCFQIPGEPQQCHTLTQTQQVFTVSQCAPEILANAGGRGYYRSSYQPQKIAALIADLNKFSAVERLALVNNEWALVRAGTNPIGSFLALSSSLHTDRTPAVLNAIDHHLSYITDNLLTPEDRERYQSWVRQLFRPAIQELGWKPSATDDSERRALRSTVFHIMGYSGRDPEAIAQAKEQLQEYFRQPSAVDPSLVETVFQLAAQNGTPQLYNELLVRATAADTAQPPDVYYRYLNALASFPDPGLMKRTMEYVLSPAVRSQDAPLVLAASMANPAAGQVAWQFVQAHWNGIVEKTGVWGATRVVRAAANFCDPTKRQQVRDFFAEHPVARAERTLRQTLEMIQYCVDLKAEQGSALATWLDTQVSAAGK